ncbi:MAG: ROK family protein [Pyrinomonadaceae bacterium]|nr:ROK family protein [Blastocatellia bacterium]MCW5955737.1 ROK family protein [Pyrinomonadaceae bacterium]
MAEISETAENHVGVEITSTRFLAVNVGNDHKIVETYSVDRDRSQEPAEQVATFTREVADKFGVGKVGIAVPGLISRESGKVIYSAQMPENTSVDFAEAARSVGVEALVENDANAAAYGEFKIGAGQGSSSMFYATIGEGVGGSFILDGKIWHGSGGYAGEFGYVAINSDGMRLEDVASSANIVRRTRNRFNRDSTSSLGRLTEEEIGLKEIVSAADDGDDFAKLMLERTGLYIGTAIATVINLMNLDMVVIGGEIMHARHFVIDAVIGRARELSFSPSFESTRILAGQLDENAAAIGAALIVAGS